MWCTCSIYVDARSNHDHNDYSWCAGPSSSKSLKLLTGAWKLSTLDQRSLFALSTELWICKGGLVSSLWILWSDCGLEQSQKIAEVESYNCIPRLTLTPGQSEPCAVHIMTIPFLDKPWPISLPFLCNYLTIFLGLLSDAFISVLICLQPRKLVHDCICLIFSRFG